MKQAKIIQRSEEKKTVGISEKKKLSGSNKGHEHFGNASIAYTAKARITAAGALRPGSHYL